MYYKNTFIHTRKVQSKKFAHVIPSATTTKNNNWHLPGAKYKSCDQFSGHLKPSDTPNLAK